MFIWEKWAILGTKVTRPYISGSVLHFQILHNERGLGLNESYGFSEQICVLGKWTILGLKMTYHPNSES